MPVDAGPIVDAINTPRPFDWLALAIAVVVAAVPVFITICLWRSDRNSLLGAADRARRGEIQYRAASLYGEILDIMSRNELWRMRSAKYPLMSAITAVAEPADQPAVRWIQITSTALIGQSGIGEMFAAPMTPERTASADKYADRALAPIEQWQRDPKSVDFAALEKEEEWADTFRGKSDAPVTPASHGEAPTPTKP